jgi:hypothetical protein
MIVGLLLTPSRLSCMIHGTEDVKLSLRAPSRLKGDLVYYSRSAGQENRHKQRDQRKTTLAAATADVSQPRQQKPCSRERKYGASVGLRAQTPPTRTTIYSILSCLEERKDSYETNKVRNGRSEPGRERTSDSVSPKSSAHSLIFLTAKTTFMLA